MWSFWKKYKRIKYLDWFLIVNSVVWCKVLHRLTFRINNEGLEWSSFCNFAFIRTSGRIFCRLWSIPPTKMSPFFVTQPTYVLLCDFPDLTKKAMYLSIRKQNLWNVVGFFVLILFPPPYIKVGVKQATKVTIINKTD